MPIDQHDLQNLEHKGEICENCLNWKDFKEGCWYFWKEKKDCSQKINL